jgi:hypothetical protein
MQFHRKIIKPFFIEMRKIIFDGTLNVYEPGSSVSIVSDYGLDD